MSYDIYLCEPGGTQEDHETITLKGKHHFIGGTYAIGGSPDAHHNITYNYWKFYRWFIDKEQGIRWLYGKTAAETLPVLEKAVKELGSWECSCECDPRDDYWTPTPTNAGDALVALIAFAKERPDGVWWGD